MLFSRTIAFVVTVTTAMATVPLVMAMDSYEEESSGMLMQPVTVTSTNMQEHLTVNASSIFDSTSVQVDLDEEEKTDVSTHAQLRGLATCSYVPKTTALPGKKGIGFTLRAIGQPGSYEENMPKVLALKPYWNLNWGPDRAPNQPDNIEFIPMVWGYWGDAGTSDKSVLHIYSISTKLHSVLCLLLPYYVHNISNKFTNLFCILVIFFRAQRHLDKCDPTPNSQWEMQATIGLQ
jgi:hypothetical protein